MKVGILTWYKAINYGAVLQTYASCKMLEKLSCDPVVLDYDWNLDEARKKNYLNILKKISIKKILWKLQVRKFFKQKEQVFSDYRNASLPLGRKYSEEKDLNAVYIGSDMVFDLSEGYNPYMYGVEVPSPYIFSYAASFGYTNLEKFKKHPRAEIVRAAICSLKSIGYRDANTKVICEYCGATAPMVENVDPVLAYGFAEEIQRWDSGKWAGRKYLLIYAYESTMNDSEEVAAIKAVAKARGLKVISCGYYHKWCDECIVASPEEFVEMIKHATYVVTDTFHGTVFSLLLHQKVCIVVRGNGFKIRHLLESCNLNVLIAENAESISQTLHIKTDYSQFDLWRYRESEKSFSYISENINKASEGNA